LSGNYCTDLGVVNYELRSI